MADVKTIMQMGVTGPVVYELQQRLRLAGFDPGDSEGYYDQNTTTAVKRFQQMMGLAVTGDADSTTLEALERQVYGGPAQESTKQESTKPEAPPATAVPVTSAPVIRFDAVSDLRSKLFGSTSKSTALVPANVGVIEAEPTPFYKRPAVIIGAVLVVAGVGIYMLSGESDRPFSSFEDPEGLEPLPQAQPDPADDLRAIAKLAAAGKRKRARARAKAKAQTKRAPKGTAKAAKAAGGAKASKAKAKKAD